MLTGQIILIIDSRKLELSYYENIVHQDASIHVIKTDALNCASEIIENYEPDLIMLYDNFDADIKQICEEIRQKSNIYRPVLVVLSAEEHIDNKFDIIKAGADDFQSMRVKEEELSLRLFAHLRRQMEDMSNSSTKLPAVSSTYKVIKRNVELKKKEPVSLMYLDVDNYNSYREIYGYIAAEKLIQTFIAIIKTSIDENDFLGQISENGFVILTNPEKAEKIATFLTYSFDVVAEKFYSNDDIERGYLILSGDDKVGRRIPFVSVSIGVSSNKYRPFENYQDAVNSCRNVQRLAKAKTGSSWISDRPQLAGGEVYTKPQNEILIVGKDAALGYLLSTTLEMQGYSVETIDNPEEVIDYVEAKTPNMVLLDITEENSFDELAICSYIKQEYPSVKVIISTITRNKERVLDCGADLYIPKPYELMVLFNWVEKFLTEEV
jgi:DNA-binding response OmpR family regulator